MLFLTLGYSSPGYHMAHPLNPLLSYVFSPDSSSCAGIGRVDRAELRLTMEFKLGKETSKGKKGLWDK